MKDLTIRKDNFLITASYKLTLNEQRLVLVAISKIPFGEKITRDVVVTAQEFLECFPDIGKDHVHREMRDAVNNLFQRWISVEDPRQKKDFRWVSSKTRYKDGLARVGFAFSPEIIPYLQQLKEQFTKYKLRDVSHFSSIYSIRLYEMIMQFQHTKFIRIELEKFKERLGILDKYKDYPNLRRRVIDPAVAELNAKSLFTITFTPIRQGRAIKILTFNFSERSR